MQRREEKARLLALFDGKDADHDPFSFTNANTSYKAIKDIGMGTIIEFICELKEYARYFLMERPGTARKLGAFFMEARNFRRELFEKDTTGQFWIEALIKQAGIVIFTTIDETNLLQSKHATKDRDEGNRIDFLYRTFKALRTDFSALKAVIRKEDPSLFFAANQEQPTTDLANVVLNAIQDTYERAQIKNLMLYYRARTAKKSEREEHLITLTDKIDFPADYFNDEEEIKKHLDYRSSDIKTHCHFVDALLSNNAKEKYSISLLLNMAAVLSPKITNSTGLLKQIGALINKQINIINGGTYEATFTGATLAKHAVTGILFQRALCSLQDAGFNFLDNIIIFLKTASVTEDKLKEFILGISNGGITLAFMRRLLADDTLTFKLTTFIWHAIQNEDVDSQKIINAFIGVIKENKSAQSALVRVFLQDYANDKAQSVLSVLKIRQVMLDIIKEFQYSPTIQRDCKDANALINFFLSMHAFSDANGKGNYTPQRIDVGLQELTKVGLKDSDNKAIHFMLSGYQSELQKLQMALEQPTIMYLLKNADVANEINKIIKCPDEQPINEFIDTQLTKLAGSASLQAYIAATDTLNDGLPFIDFSYPKKADRMPLEEHKSLVQGDLHGGAHKLLKTLLFKDILECSEDDYYRFLEIYSEAPDFLTAADISDFERIVNRMVSNPYADLLHIGDILCERGSNDLFSLIFKAKLRQLFPDLIITYSNHDKIFFDNLKKLKDNKPINTGLSGEMQDNSLQALHLLIRKGLMSYKKVEDLANRVYRPAMQYMPYSVWENQAGEYTIDRISHARTGIDTYWDLAEEWNVEYADEDIVAFAATHDRYNDYFKQNFDKIVASPMTADIKTLTARKQTPADAGIWNRSYDDSLLNYKKLGTKKPYRVVHLYGHDSSAKPEQLEDGVIICLDNDWGKGLDRSPAPLNKAGFTVRPTDQTKLLRKRVARLQQYINTNANKINLNLDVATALTSGDKLELIIIDFTNMTKDSANHIKPALMKSLDSLDNVSTDNKSKHPGLYEAFHHELMAILKTWEEWKINTNSWEAIATAKAAVTDDILTRKDKRKEEPKENIDLQYQRAKSNFLIASSADKKDKLNELLAAQQKCFVPVTSSAPSFNNNAENIRKLNEHMQLLKEELLSTLRQVFRTQDRQDKKLNKILGLSELVFHLTQGKALTTTLIEEINTKYPGLDAGTFSRKTKDLLTLLLAPSVVPQSFLAPQRVVPTSSASVSSSSGVKPTINQ